VPVLVRKLESLVSGKKVSPESRLLLVDDGSADGTWDAMLALCAAYPEKIETVRLPENSGEIRALIAGMKAAAAKADLIVTVDCDLQDDIDTIDEMLILRSRGAQIVYGCRADRSTDTPFYRLCANGFYFVMRAFGSKIVPHTSEYRLMTKNAVEELLRTGGEAPFLPAEIPLLGLPSANVYYARRKRMAGKSNYSYFSLIKLAASALWDYTVFFEAAAFGGAAVCAAAAAILPWEKRPRGRRTK
jgi:glycosyltransferase involved in cell wall biosynthesis